jgi:predicted dehydrogenase
MPWQSSRASASRGPCGALRVAVVGCGYWGAKHVRVLRSLPGVAEVVVVDPDPDRRAAVASALHPTSTYGTVEAALPHVDAVVVATPPARHAEVALTAIRQGKHVLVEKPLATNLADARRLAREAAWHGVVLMCGHTFEFNPAVRELRARVARGDLGTIRYISSARLNLGLYRPDVNVVWDLAPHDLSIMNYVLGSTPSSVEAWGSANIRAGVEDLAFIRVDYRAAGVTGYIQVSWLDPNKVRRVTVVGSRRMAVYDDLSPEPLRIYDRGVEPAEDGVGLPERPVGYRYGDIVSPHVSAEEPLLLEDQHFVAAIRGGVDAPSLALNGVLVVATLEAIDRSLRSGSRVAVEPVATLADDATVDHDRPMVAV